MNEPRTVLYVQHYPDGGSITGLLDLVKGLDPARYRAVVAFRTPNAFVPEFEALGVPVVFHGPGGAAVPSVPPASRAPSADDPAHDDPALDGPSADDPSGDDRRSSPASSPLRREARRMVQRDLPAARRLRRIIAEHHVDLVHANNDVLSNRDAIIAARVTRRPVIVHVRWLHEYPDDATRTLDRFLGRRAARVICMSRAIADSYRVLDLPADRQVVLDDPFDLGDYGHPPDPAVVDALALPPGARVILHIGRIIPWKGQDVFLRAVASALASDPDAFALLVGTATDARGRQFQTELDELVATLGIGGRVRFAGVRRDVPELIAAAEIVVHTSTRPEPFGRVVVEGMAGGRPVIGSDAGGVPEIIDRGVTGLLTPPGDADALADALVGLLADPEAAQAMGARARAAVTARFSVAAHLDAVQAIYDDVLGA